ncbi:MAG: NUDIX domain-containing protein [Oscillospiraceae bacterium]|nr:NUDIX domain-containing protein [Oscillospiraceae bacterium]
MRDKERVTFMTEYFDLRREDGSKTGETKARALVHRDGDLHGTAHVWLARPHGDSFDLLLQKRSDGKDAYPGCWDISSAGHLPAGSDFLESALRELREELGVSARAEDLELIGFRRRKLETEFYGRPFRDSEYAAVYLCLLPVEPEALQLQREEVSAVRYLEFSTILCGLGRADFPNCLYEDELQMVKQAYELRRSHI